MDRDHTGIWKRNLWSKPPSLNCETFPKRKLSSLDKKKGFCNRQQKSKGGWKRPLFEVPFFPHGMHHSGLLLKILTG